MSELPNLPPPVPSAVPQPARRLSKIALGIALLLGALLVTMGALVITSPPARSPFHTDPRDQRPAEAAFLNNPPKHTPSSSDQREEERIARLLRLARDGQPGQPAPSGPLALGVTAPAGPGGELRDLRDPREMPSDRVDTGGAGRSVGPPLDGDAPPPGAYRPYPGPARQAFAAPATPPAKPSWQAAFANSLTSASLSVPPSAGPQIPGFPGLPGLPPTAPQAPAIEPAGPAEKAEVGLPSSTPPQRGLVRPAASRSRRRLLPAGTVLNAILLTAVSTQMPGDAVAHVTSDVHGRDGSVLLPRGSRLVGSYKNRVALGDNRVAIAWDHLEIDGRSYELPGLASTSPDGAAGLPGDVNNHTGLVFGRAALLSLIGAGAQLGQPSESRLGATLSNRELVSGSVSQQLSQAANEYLNRAVNVAPTLTIPAGARVTVLLPFDLELDDRSLAAPAISGDLRP